MNLLTLDEARTTIATSGLRLVQRCDTTDPSAITAMLHGYSRPKLTARDRGLVRRHRQTIDHVTALGYAAEANDELDGITSVAGLTPDAI